MRLGLRRASEMSVAWLWHHLRDRPDAVRSSDGSSQAQHAHAGIVVCAALRLAPPAG